MKIHLSKKAKKFWIFFLGGIILLLINRFSAKACLDYTPSYFLSEGMMYGIFYVNLALVLISFILALIYIPTPKEK